MIEYAFKSVCRVEETTDDPDQQSSKFTQLQNHNCIELKNSFENSSGL